MRYNDYRAAIIGATTEGLEQLLKRAEDDFDNISDRQYYNLRHLILNKIYQIATTE